MEPGIARVAPELREQLVSGGMPPEAAPYGQKIAQERPGDYRSAASSAGVPIVAGTDQAVPGFSVYREIELYVKAGFTPMEALQAATIVPARAMKVDADSGSVEVGKRADLDVLDANPLDDIHNIRTVRTVVAEWRALRSPAAMGERGIQAGVSGLSAGRFSSNRCEADRPNSRL